MRKEDLNVVFVDNVSKSCTMHNVFGHNTASASPASCYNGKIPMGCFELLKRLMTETGSIVHAHIFAILDKRFVHDDTVVLVEMEGDLDSNGKVYVDRDYPAISARCEFGIACATLNQYYIGDADIDEDREKAEEEGDGVIRGGSM